MTNKKLGCGCLSTIILSTALLITGGYAFSKGWHQFIWGTKLTPLSAAKIIPQDVAITSYVNTNGEDWSELEVPEVNQIMTQLSQELKQSLPSNFQDLNYQQDLSPWLGNVMIAWFPKIVPSIDNGYGIKPDADFLLIFGIKNPLKAYRFRQQIKSADNIQHHESKFKGVTITAYKQSPTCTLYLAVLRNKLIITEKLSIIHQAIATFKGEPALADHPEHKKALQQKFELKNPLIKVYLTNNDLTNNELAAETFPIDSIALAISSEDKAIRLQAITNLPQNIDWKRTSNNQKLILENFPQSTVALFGGQINTQEIADTWSYFLEDYYLYLPWLIDSEYNLDQWLKVIGNYQDLFQLIDGEFALGITLAEINPIDNHDAELNFGAGLILTMSDRQLADIALKKLERQSILSLLFPREDLPGLGLSKHWITQDNLLLTWNNGKELILGQSDNSVLDNPKFLHFYEELPRKNSGYFFLDVDAINSQIKNLYQPKKTTTELALINSLDSISSNSRMQDSKQTIKSNFLLRFK